MSANDSIEKAARVLADAQQGWVHRRDAADFLGDAASRAIKALQAHREDSDVDVLRAIQAALSRLGAPADSRPGTPAPKSKATALRPADSRIADTPPPQTREYDLPELAKACAKPGRRTVEAAGKGFCITVQLAGGRTQKVFLTPDTRGDGAKLVRVWSYCGKPAPEAYRWALSANLKLAHGALALSGEGEQEQLVLAQCYPANMVNPNQVKASVKEISFYADWLEQKLNGLDQL